MVKLKRAKDYPTANPSAAVRKAVVTPKKPKKNTVVPMAVNHKTAHMKPHQEMAYKAANKAVRAAMREERGETKPDNEKTEKVKYKRGKK